MLPGSFEGKESNQRGKTSRNLGLQHRSSKSSWDDVDNFMSNAEIQIQRHAVGKHKLTPLNPDGTRVRHLARENLVNTFWLDSVRRAFASPCILKNPSLDPNYGVKCNRVSQ